MPEAASLDALSAAPMSGPAAEAWRRIERRGPITFEEFMGLALYWPQGGYYASPAERWGVAGDYVTSLDMSPAFPRLIASGVAEMWELLGGPRAFTVIDAGAGRGWLASGISEALRSISPDIFSSLDMRLVESNPHLPTALQSGRFRRHADITEIEGPVTGCILSNELIDSLPVHVVEQRGALMEVYVGLDGRGFCDVLGEPSTPELGRYMNDAGVRLSEGQRAEINLNALRWIKAAGTLFDRGFVVTIDYGLPARELYDGDRRGSLLCHYRHTLNDNPYINIGSQDITAHVDFSSLVRAGASAGLELTGFTTQKNFLLGLGVLDELASKEGKPLDGMDRAAGNGAIKRLFMPGGMGDAFKVLIQHKGMERPALRGLSFKDMSRCLLEGPSGPGGAACKGLTDNGAAL
jgi:SAM-dependent MidA family methyltransferase